MSAKRAGLSASNVPIAMAAAWAMAQESSVAEAAFCMMKRHLA